MRERLNEDRKRMKEDSLTQKNALMALRLNHNGSVIESHRNRLDTNAPRLHITATGLQQLN
jgi:hypothetical protein